MAYKDYEDYLKKTSPVYRQMRYCAERLKKEPEKRLLELSLSEIDYQNSSLMLEIYIIEIANYLEIQEGIEVSYGIDYTCKKIIFYRRIKGMTHKFTIKIPYGSRSQYYDFIVKANSLVSKSGTAALWIDNVPYALESYLTIVTEQNGEEIANLMKEYGLKNDTSRGIEQFLNEMLTRRWNMATLSQDKKSVDAAFALYEFGEEEYLRKKGYKREKKTRKRIFISYCHADKETVWDIVNAMENAGMYLWIDKQEIDAGDRILEKVMSGIEEAELNVIFISKATIQAQFARHELQSIWSEVIRRRKNWFIVRLDDVDVEDVYFGLQDFLYYDLHENKKIEELLKAIERKLDKINEEA